MIDSVMNRMGLNDTEKEFISKNFSEEIRGKIKSIWQVVEDASEYAFNASHSYSVTMDSLYTAWVKAHYPLEFYETTLEMFSDKKDTEKVALLKNEAFRYKQIRVIPMRFGQDNRTFKSIKEDNTISQSLLGVKGINNQIAEKIYMIGQKYKDIKDISFYDLYLDMKDNGLSKTHISNMLKINFFDDIVEKRKGLWLSDNFDTVNKKQISKDKICDIYGSIKNNTKLSMVEFYEKIKSLAIKTTEKLFKFEPGVIPKFIFDIIDVDCTDKLEELCWEYCLTGTIDDIDDDIIIGTVIKYNPSTNKIKFKDVRDGTEKHMKISSTCHTFIKEKSILFIEVFTSKKYKGREYYTVEKCQNLSKKYLDKNKEV